MDPDGIDVFHRTDRDDVPDRIAHRFKLDLFPARDAFFDKDLGDRRLVKPAFGDDPEFAFIVRDAAAASAESERGADNDGIADRFGDRKSRFKVVRDARRNDGLADLFHCIAEKLPVLGAVDRFAVGAEEPHAVVFEPAVL